MLERLKRRRSMSSSPTLRRPEHKWPPPSSSPLFLLPSYRSFFLPIRHYSTLNPPKPITHLSMQLRRASFCFNSLNFFSHWKKKKRRRWKRTCFAFHRRRRRCSSSQSILKQQFFLPNGAHLHQKDTKCNCFRKLKLGGLIQSPVLSPNLCLSLSPPITQNCIQIPHASTSEIWSNKMMVFYSSVSPMFILTGGHMSMQVLSPLNSEG